jgi:glycosyltransferase involved in cell wall biosynthesis
MTSRAPSASVVVPAHDAEMTLRACVQSVLNQTEPDFELLIIDDGSSDGTLELARSVNDARVQVHSQPASGVSAARNAGIKAATGRIVCFLDSDDLLLPRYLEAVQTSFADDPGVDFVYTDAWTFNDRTRRIRRQTTAHYQRPPRPAPANALELFRELIQRNFIIVPVAVRRQAIVTAGMFDEAMAGAEDWDMWLRLLLAGHRASEAPGPLGLRREHERQASWNGVRMISGHVHMLEKLLRQQDLLPEDEDRVTARLSQARRGLAELSGLHPRRARERRLRQALSAARSALGLGDRWYRQPPPEVTSAFGDLKQL